MLPLLILIVCMLLLGGLVVLIYLYLRCGLGRPRLTQLRRWSSDANTGRLGYPAEPIQPTTNDESLLLAVNMAVDETSRQARLIAFLLLSGFLLSILLLLLALGGQL
ncbi:hypothetical protein [Thermogemmatispora onikobensis]|uniref:hypothetical protein n=1 Tax=Thermogemmatispora onikobensis TaxID=732234 RepID=UPI000853C1B5|nr:hypothetical protein [Thermogemmatispora onikobensis]